jgi:hypothetical protein
LEYHSFVRYSIPASVALFGLFVLAVPFVSIASAQINGAAASVTSPGFGGRPVNGAPPSVTSLGPRGYASATPVPNARPNAPRNGDGHHRHHDGEYGFPLVYAVPVPYADNGSAYDDSDENADDDYQGGPTVFDRRGSGAASYVPPVRDVPTPHADDAADASVTDPGIPQQPTVLVFKEGRQLEVGNYAIVGQTLFDLTLGHARKIALVDLDLDATRQLNESRGVTFQLPSPPQAN